MCNREVMKLKASLLLRLQTLSRHSDMKTASVCLLRGVCVLLLSALTVSAVYLSASPNFQQFFSGPTSVSLGCVDDEDGQDVDGWTVRRTRGGLTEDCGAAEDFVMIDSLCLLDRNSSYSGNFWCESLSGEKSDEVTISVSSTEKKGVIMEIPVLPVRPGTGVILQCKKKNGETVPSYFFMNGRLVGPGSTSEYNIRRAQYSDEGLYWCATDTFGESPQSFLRVRGSPITSLKTSVSSETNSSLSTLLLPNNSSSPPPPPLPSSPSVSWIRVICHLLAFCPYCICTILLLSICCSRSSGNKHAVSMETPLRDAEYDDIVADVTTEHVF
uniref:Ig-like domain-containing protein n=1 Tax=Oreochromis niloticus TaxID=8128 RepID=A0A669E5G1_ORENI